MDRPEPVNQPNHSVGTESNSFFYFLALDVSPTLFFPTIPYFVLHQLHHAGTVSATGVFASACRYEDPLDSKSPTENLAIYLFFFYLIQTIPIFIPHNRPLLSIKYIIIFMPYYYLIYEIKLF